MASRGHPLPSLAPFSRSPPPPYRSPHTRVPCPRSTPNARTLHPPIADPVHPVARGFSPEGAPRLQFPLLHAHRAQSPQPLVISLQWQLTHPFLCLTLHPQKPKPVYTSPIYTRPTPRKVKTFMFVEGAPAEARRMGPFRVEAAGIPPSFLADIGLGPISPLWRHLQGSR
jgi:hypothetical protein